jgi:uncharacterized protein YjbI with pentapeptide repeats
MGKESCCYREQWGDRDWCIWHAPATNERSKPDDTLRAVLDGAPLAGSGRQELLDGADLEGKRFTADLDLDDVSLRDANLSNVDFGGTSLSGVDLREATLRDSDLQGVTLRGANLRDSTLRNANLREVDLRGADLRDADLRDADLQNADLRDADLSDAVLEDVDLGGATLAGATCVDADFTDIDLAYADLTGVTLRDTDCTGGVFRGADLSGADLEGAVMDRTNLFDTDLRDTRLYGTLLESARINDGTAIDERCIYDSSREDAVADVDSDGLDADTKAIGTYRQLEKACSENALLRAQSRYFVHRQDIHTSRYRRRGDWGRWLRARVSRAVVLYGESPFRVLATGGLVVGSTTVLYPMGFLREKATGELVTYPPISQPIALGQTLLESFYFSTLSFATMTYGDYLPVGAGKYLTIFETMAGILLFALLVFVFGRRATR